MRFKTQLTALIVAMLFTGAVLAEEKKTTPVKVGIMVYMDYTANLSNTDDHTFNLTRAYLSVSKQFSEAWSAKFVLDASKTGSGFFDEHADSNRAYAFLKELNITGKTKFGPLSTAINFGVIDTPYCAYVASKSRDYWINGDAMLLSSNAVDYVYDLGVGFTLEYEKYISLYTTFTTAGKGFQDLEDEVDKDKAVGTRLSITPIEGLSIDGFYFHNGDGAGYKSYVGGGVTYTKRFVQAGATYLYYMGKGAPTGPGIPYNAIVDGDSTLDTWLNVNYLSLLGLPLTTSMHYTLQDDVNGTGAPGAPTGIRHIVGFGTGYQPSKALSSIIYYSYNTSIKDHILSVRTRVMF